MLKIHNSLTKRKEPFEPIKPGQVSMYVCGMTVYDYCHIGHGRIFVVFDMVARYLRYRNYDVTYVRNITDIDDKIIKRANENGEPMSDLTARNIQAMHEDETSLGVERPDIVPRATEYVDQIIAMIETLVANGSAYVTDSGDVYFAVDKFDSYGELAHQDLETLMAGHRVDVLESKRYPLDFALWKIAKPDEPSWESPWGAGRPGWHIECSAMSAKTLGQQFDIHGGGMDLQFPHHQNEIAQSEAAHGCKMVNTWMHCGFVNVKEEKMSKSLGNFFTIREVLKEYHPEVVRYFMLASHYRSPINYATDNLDSAWHGVKRVYGALRDLPMTDQEPRGVEHFEQRFISAMDDDFNTPEAMAVLFDIVREINLLKEKDEVGVAGQYALMVRRLGGVLGMFQYDPAQILRAGIDQDDVGKIEALVAARIAARADKDWARADEIRAELTAMGVSLEDKGGETVWVKE